MNTEPCHPNPEYLIKSIAEQGYTLETSIADLIDNSITAASKKIEILIDTEKTPFTLFIADNGVGMSEDELKKNIKFPSSSIEHSRNPDDLGRFGLGLKTASFAQTRSFTVISKKKFEKKYSARTWDVNHLKDSGMWEIIINTEEQINKLLDEYQELRNGFLNPFSDYIPNTIIIWQGLYKFENEINSDERSAILRKELTETTVEYLQIIFHRFLSKEIPLEIRLNNNHLKPFNPFPQSARNISVQQKLLIGNKLRLEGFVLPNRSIKESKSISEWTINGKSLMDMEGIYVYRADRIIFFGGWNNIIKKSSRLQLARLKVEIGNGIDHLFNLNVAKSSITIPFSERIAFYRYVSELKKEAEREYYNFEIKVTGSKSDIKSIFKKIPTTQGMSLQIDNDYPLLNTFQNTLNAEQQKQLRLILRMITTILNKIKKVHSEESYVNLVEETGIRDEDLENTIKLFLKNGMSKENILNDFITNLGIADKSLPYSVLSLLK